MSAQGVDALRMRSIQLASIVKISRGVRLKKQLKVWSEVQSREQLKAPAKSATRSESGGKPRARYDRYREEHSDAWSAGDADASEFYVYVLKLNDGTFYAGQTREIRERLMEHRDGTTRTTVGKDPKLVWFSTVSTRKQATELEVIVKKVCDRNPREIRRWILKFQDLVDELDFS